MLTFLAVSVVIAYCYHLVNVITFCLSQCDYIKRLQLHCTVKLTIMHIVSMDLGLKKMKKLDRYNRKFVITEFIMTEFVITEFVITEFVITEFVIIEFVITEFVIIEFVITEFVISKLFITEFHCITIYQTMLSNILFILTFVLGLILVV
jgi:hypothetical protein